MKRLLVLVFAFVFVVALGQVAPANAIATVSSYFLGCSSASASGTTTAPYVVVEVYDPAIGEDLFFGTFPASGGTFSVNAVYTAPAAAGTFLEYWVWGSPTADPDDWDGEAYFYTEGPCQIPQFQGAGIPAGFVMHSISCTTPVYTQAAGIPVGNDRVLAGQTWFVNPTPVEGADGEQWTEIYVGSAINPWIPTECVA